MINIRSGKVGYENEDMPSVADYGKGPQTLRTDIEGIVRDVFIDNGPLHYVGLAVASTDENGGSPSVKRFYLCHGCRDAYEIISFQVGLLEQRVHYTRCEKRDYINAGIARSERLEVLSGPLAGSVFRYPTHGYFHSDGP